MIGAEARDFYGSIVSSQFDADRLDYLRRDRYMAGVEVGHFDFEWLLDCLKVDDVYLGQGDGDKVKISGLILNYKGFEAAEGYLQARYQLYSTVYLHKTTRSAEKMLAALFLYLANKLRDGGKELSLPNAHPVRAALKKKKLTTESYLRLDEAVVWSAVECLVASEDKTLSELAHRLVNRKLYKCIDVGAMVPVTGGDMKYRLRERIFEAAKGLNLRIDVDVLEDEPRLVGYDWYSWSQESALQKVLVEDKEHSENFDIGDRSDVVKALKRKEFYRIYIPTSDHRDSILAALKSV